MNTEDRFQALGSRLAWLERLGEVHTPTRMSALEDRIAALEDALEKQRAVNAGLAVAMQYDWVRGDFKWRESDALPSAIREALK